MSAISTADDALLEKINTAVAEHNAAHAELESKAKVVGLLLLEAKRRLIGCLAPRGERRTIIRSFVEACCERIADRLLEFVERSKRERTSNGRELVVVKDAAIQAFMKEQGIRLRMCSGYSPSTVDAAAQAAGDRATFSRPVSGTAGVLRIGRS
jgi:hypothetical protein